MKDYGPRKCEFCGRVYIPRRCDQRSCGSAECKKARTKANYHEYRTQNYERVLANNRRSMKERREKAKHYTEPKPDTIVAIGYADRQREETLKMAGKVNTEL